MNLAYGRNQKIYQNSIWKSQIIAKSSAKSKMVSAHFEIFIEYEIHSTKN